MSDLRTPPPDLTIPYPSCPLCDCEVSSDGFAYWCDNCDVQWRMDGDGANWQEPDAPQCDSAITTRAGAIYRCLMATGHSGAHRDVIFGTWFDVEDSGDDDDPGDGVRARLIGVVIVTAGTAAMLHQELGDLARWIL